ncbi:MAG: helix-turn-helix domain-containing protein [Beijerinckiaceae bacterium]
MGRKLSEIHQEWMKNPEYQREYDALEDEFAMAETFIRARANANLTQEQVAERMGTTQSVVARLESGRSKPSYRTLERFADAVGAKVKLVLEAKG